MRGHTVKTPERVAEAQRLREQGQTYAQIGERFGVSIKTAHQWVTDPDGTRMRARKDTYAGECVNCGAWTSGQAGRRDDPRCPACAADLRRIWTPEAIILAIQDWAHEHNDEPPRAHPDWAKSGDCHPSVSYVQEIFGSWNAAIAAAGFEPTPVSHYRDESQRGRRRATA